MTTGLNTSAEVITWRDAAQDPPDNDMTVLVSTMGSGEPVWLGWLDAGVWRDVTNGSPITGAVVSWADVPDGWFPGGGASS